MPSLPLESELSSSVSRCLNEALPGASIRQVEIRKDLPAVLVLRVRQIFAAFAFGRDDITYEALYSGFKKHFLAKEEESSSMDVSFVYCLPPGSPPSESFCSRVETDVYFCRKFIVPMSADVASSLSRLPFFPLSPLSGPPLRPPSAQTLLQRSNVKADLARFLVAQGTRGAQGILADCLENKFGAPETLSETVTGSEHKPERVLNAATLESLTIQNFRAYRKSKTFVFGSAVTVLYGPNGFGKTSFFDALDFAVTGGIGRLPSTATDLALTKAARHLDSGEERSAVSLTFKRGEETHTVVRDLADPKQATVDSKQGITRKDVLALLTGGQANATDRVDNFVSLFRATHLFSQERQELTHDFHLKCELSAELVSRMLAFEDYVSGIKKTSEVRGLIKSAVERANKEITRLEGLADKDRAELARLEGLAAANANPGAIEAELMSLKQEIADLRIEVEPPTVDTATLRGWRAQLESRIAESSSQSVRLSRAMGDLQQARTLALEQATAQSTVVQSEKSLAAAEQSRAMAEESYRVATGQLTQAKTAEATAQSLCNSLAWVAATKAEYDGLIQEREALTAAIEIAEQQDVKLRDEESAAASSRLAAEIVLNNLGSQVVVGSRRLQGLQSLDRQRPEISAANARLKELADAERACAASNVRVQKKLNDDSEIQQAARILVARVESEVNARESEGTEVKSLLAQLRGHVADATCLLCGVEHRSKDALLASIDLRLNQDGPLAEARARLVEKRGELTQLTERVAGNQTALDDGIARQSALRSEREQIERVLLEFSHAAASLGIVVSIDSGRSDDELGAAVLQEERALGVLAGRRDAAEQERDLTVKAGDAAEAAVARSAAAVQTARTALERVRQTIDRLAANPQRGGARFDIETQELRAAIDRAVEHLQSTKTALAGAQALADLHKAEAARKVNEASAAKKSLEDGQRRSGAISASISGITASLAQLDLRPDSPDQAVVNLMTKNSEAQVRDRVLRDRSVNLEVALDAAMTAAALGSLRTSVDQSLASIEAAKQDRARHELWIKYFESVSKILSTQQSSATDQFTRDYGPRTAIIQRRLRPVYGFGDVEVSSRSGAIGVRVVRNGEALKPVDYFSQSQLQTLEPV